MLKNLTRLEHKIGDRIYHFLCDMDAPISDVKEALVQFVCVTAQIGNAPQQAQEEVAPQQDAPKE